MPTCASSDLEIEIVALLRSVHPDGSDADACMRLAARFSDERHYEDAERGCIAYNRAAICARRAELELELDREATGDRDVDAYGDAGEARAVGAALLMEAHRRGFPVPPAAFKALRAAPPAAPLTPASPAGSVASGAGEHHHHDEAEYAQAIAEEAAERAAALAGGAPVPAGAPRAPAPGSDREFLSPTAGGGHGARYFLRSSCPVCRRRARRGTSKLPSSFAPAPAPAAAGAGAPAAAAGLEYYN
eukprot:tig00021348_g20608.t1